MSESASAKVIADCAKPGASLATSAAALQRMLDSAEHDDTSDTARRSHHLVWLARRYGTAPFTPLRDARRELELDRREFARLVEMFGSVPELREAVREGPAGKYWANTILPLESKGVFDAVLEGRPVYPSSVGLYPGPSCMFRCHFCVRVTGARYDPSSLEDGNAVLTSVIEELPTEDPHTMYVSGGLEPLTNPGLGTLVTRAAARGFRITMYTNAFALTEQTLGRQAGLWDLYAVRTSLYGLSDEEYEATVGKRASFRRVKDNLARFLRLRAERQQPVRLGLNYLVLPGRAHRLLDLVDYMTELSEATPDRPLDFLNLRQDYSGRADGRLSISDRAELQDALGAFEEKVKDRLPTQEVDYGYALNSLRFGVEAELLRITPEQMRPRAHPQVAVQIDLLGDVYMYREAGFPDLPGANRYIAGRVSADHGLYQVVEDFVAEGRQVDPRSGDEYFLDGFDQVIIARLNQLEDDIKDGWGPTRGFLR
ncbi:MAG: dTDP-4-amino-4,6-dideoxy-D-glucose ammonia-lyase [Pseudonocardiaceae bacterium]